MRAGRRACAVVAAVVLALAAPACGLDVDPPGDAAPAPAPGAATTTTVTVPGAPSTTSTTATAPSTTEPDLPGLDPGDAATIECLAGDLLEDPGALLGGGDITGPAAEQVTQIAAAVEEERELTFTTTPEPELVTGEEIASRVRELNGESYSEEEADEDDRLLTALGAIPRDADLRDTVLDLTAGQVAGYYEPDTGDLVVLADDPGEPLGPAEQVTVAHELDHALTDQRLDLPVGDDSPDDDDAATAAQALVEGDATLLMQRFALAHVGIQGLLEGSETGAAQEQLAEAPPFLRSSLLFPYLEGLGFVCDLMADGGWAAVDAAYEAPPVSTAEVLFPERYGEAPVDVPPVGSPGPGWEEVDRNSFGAAPMLWLLEAPGGDESAALDGARDRVAAWGGDEAAVFTRGEDTAVGWTLFTREGADPGSLCETVVDWYRAAFPDDGEAEAGEGEALAVEGDAQAAVVSCGARVVSLGIAPDLATARAIAAD